LPAHWSPERLATTLLIEGDAAQFFKLMPCDTRELARFDDGARHHLIFACRDIRLRICVTPTSARSDPTFVVPAGPAAAIQLDAAQQFCTLQAGRPNAFARSPFTPTRYSRARLATLLAVADASASGASARDIAFGVVFPNSEPLVGDDWRASSEQRQTRRLVAEAARMIDGGFWRLPCFV
jgi:Uncharacterized conserved protein (DUF2285)